MKFDKPRVFEFEDALHNTWQLIYDSWDDRPDARQMTGHGKGATSSGEYPFAFTKTQGVREVTPPPFDITKLDCAGVFHEVPPSEMTAGRVAYEARAKALSPLHLYQPWDKSDDAKSVAGRKAWEAAAQAVIEFHGDIANATIAELRQKVAELEAAIRSKEIGDAVLFNDLEKITNRIGRRVRATAADAGEVRA